MCDRSILLSLSLVSLYNICIYAEIAAHTLLTLVLSSILMFWRWCVMYKNVLTVSIIMQQNASSFNLSFRKLNFHNLNERTYLYMPFKNFSLVRKILKRDEKERENFIANQCTMQFMHGMLSRLFIRLNEAFYITNRRLVKCSENKITVEFNGK